VPGSTTLRHYPYPVDTDPIDVAGDVQRLAEAVDTDVAAVSTVANNATTLAQQAQARADQANAAAANALATANSAVSQAQAAQTTANNASNAANTANGAIAGIQAQLARNLPYGELGGLPNITSNASGDARVTFPRAYSSIPGVAVVCYNEANVQPVIHSVDTTGFSVRLHFAADNDNPNTPWQGTTGLGWVSSGAQLVAP